MVFLSLALLGQKNVLELEFSFAKSKYNCIMEFFITDIEIDALIKEEKRIDQPIADFGRKLKEKKGHKEFDLIVERSDHSAFKIIVRQSIENPLDFSAILGFIPQKKSEVFLLRRYNGKSHEHKNKI